MDQSAKHHLIHITREKAATLALQSPIRRSSVFCPQTLSLHSSIIRSYSWLTSLNTAPSKYIIENCFLSFSTCISAHTTDTDRICLGLYRLQPACCSICITPRLHFDRMQQFCSSIIWDSFRHVNILPVQNKPALCFWCR